MSVASQPGAEGGYRYLFGPVPSRRLGRSLGLDLVPFKTCTFDCPFCQLGATTRQTLERRACVPVRAVLGEFRRWLAGGGTADTVTLSGSGEPTLHSRFGDVLEGVRSACPLRTALLTNSSLMPLAEVRAAAAKASIVKASLSAWDEASFRALNRPHADLTLAAIVEGLCRFREEFGGELWIEVFVVPGLNDTVEAGRRLAAQAKGIRPDRIHLNTAVRPPAEGSVKPASGTVLKRLASLFEPPAEVVAAWRPHVTAKQRAGIEDIRRMLERRPCTAEGIAAGLAMRPAEAAKYLGELLREGRIRVEHRGRAVYYRLPEPGSRPGDG